MGVQAEKKEAPEEDRGLITRWINGHLTLDETDSFPRLCFRSKLPDCEHMGFLLEADGGCYWTL